MALAFIIFFIVYVGFAIFFISSIWKTSSKLQRKIVIAFFVLLPSWDVILGFLVFHIACPFVPKMAIYETAETDGIYYEGGPRSQLLIYDVPYFGKGAEMKQLFLAQDDIGQGFQFIESLVTSTGSSVNQQPISPSRIYSCTPLPKDPQHPGRILQRCAAVEEVQSRYLVKTTELEFACNELKIIKIYDKVTDRLMGEYREVSRSGVNFPFFYWLSGGPKGGYRYTCPESSHFYVFQFEVLKAKK
jgi:hypothetical protein